MVPLPTILAHNTTLSLPPSLVAIFVGGTSGISHYTALSLARSVPSPKIYLIGRNASEASKISSELKSINPTSTVSFIKSDVSLLRNVDKVCEEIKAKEKEVNLLFMTAGWLTVQGRTETEEGLDRRFALHYYARARFVEGLKPLLSAAATSGHPNPLSRVVSVYDPNLGHGAPFDFEDPSLKNTFSLRKCPAHASALTNFAFERFAREMPGTSFIHEQPGIVETSLGRNIFMKGLYKLLSPFSVGKTESGDRHLFEATAGRYAPREKAAGVEDVVVGGDGVVGSGHYQLSWDGEPIKGSKVADEMRRDGAEEKMWAHTVEVFEKICGEGGRY